MGSHYRDYPKDLEGNGSKDYYVLRPCKGVIGFVATLKKNIRLDLKECLNKLELAGYKVIDAELMLIVQNGVELTIYKSGKILARADNEDAAKIAIDKAYEILIVKN